MPEQIERIVLEATDRTGVQVRSANANLDAYEKRARRAAEQVALANEKAAASAIAAAKATAEVQKLQAEGAAAAQIRAAQKVADAQVRESERASRAAARLSERSSNIQLAAADRAADLQARRISTTVLAAERRLEALKSPLERLQLERGSALERVAGDPAAVLRVKAAYDQLIRAQKEQTSIAGRVADAIRNPLQAGQAAASGLASSLGSVGLVAGAVVAGIGFLGKQVFDLASGAALAGGNLNDLAERMGLSGDQAQILDRQAAIAGFSVEALDSVVRKLSNTLADGGPQADAAVRRLESLGIEVVDASGKFRPATELISEFSRAFNRFPDHASRVKVLTDVFGRQAETLIPLIKDFDRFAAAARDLGPTLDQGLIDRLDKADERIKGIERRWKDFTLTIADKVIISVEYVETGGKLLSAILGGGPLSGRGIAAAIAGQTAAVQVPIAGTGGAEVEAAIFRDRQPSIDRGAALVDRFRGRRTESSLGRELSQLQTQQQEVGARIQKGAGEDAVRQSIADFDRLEVRIRSVKDQLKSLGEIPAKNKAAEQLLIDAQAANVTGLAKLYYERQKALEQYGQTKFAVDKINEAFGVKVATEEKALRLERARLANEAAAKEAEQAAGRGKIVTDNVLRTVELNRSNEESRRAAVLQGLEYERDQTLRSLEAINAQTVAQKVALERRKADVEIDYEQRAEVLREKAASESADRELRALDILYERKLLSEGLYQAQREALERGVQLRLEQLRAASDAAQEAARQRAQVRTAEIVRQQNEAIFDNFKRQAESVLDATLVKGQNVFQVLGAALKNAFLTALKDIVASRTAALLTELVTGEKVSLQGPTAGRGPLGRLAGVLGLGSRPVFGQAKIDQPGHLGDLQLIAGAVPVVMVGGGSQPGQQAVTRAAGAAGAVGGVVAAAGTLGTLLGGLGRSGGGAPAGAVTSSIDFGSGAQNLGGIVYPGVGSGATPPFLPPGTAGGGGGGGGVLGSNPFGFGEIKGALTKLGNIGRTGAGAARGVGGAAGGALLAGGGILAFDGLRRGGKLGLLETTAGGALIGAKFGGPIGAAIGAAVGFGAGFARLFIKGKIEKLVEKVKAIYGITIDKSFANNPLSKIIDSQFGGNLEVGIRSPQVRDLLQLYAQSTGQRFPLDETKPFSVGLELRGGSLQQTAARVNGESVAYSGGTARVAGSVDRFVGSGPSVGFGGGGGQLQVGSLQILVNGQGATEALTGQIVKSPQAVGQASLAAARGSYARRDLAVAQSTPGVLLQ